MWHKMFADQLSAAANPNRVRFYVATLFYEWLLFVLVVAGVRRSGASVLIVLGDHWHSVRQVGNGWWHTCLCSGDVRAWLYAFFGFNGLCEF
jgi:hypothetical protein